ncbi:hypothetical protein PMAA_010810 [Talaromyces marneffei ATCC 18224]|uniref:Uncharacterized protein n=1 Tax=Talaromyces marneffei (strain ATCC 18224 / CBS 334.59 / QM 7333) TaxID=441960 RepID=B6QV10_TALMQ|nr:hypothetical protein PMAA_010810 [Talaromyces marneffei ATCC 18224]
MEYGLDFLADSAHTDYLEAFSENESIECTNCGSLHIDSEDSDQHYHVGEALQSLQDEVI